MTALKRVVRGGTLEEIRQWVRESRAPDSEIVMDARYYVLVVPEVGRVAAVGLRRLAWFATELKHLVVRPDQRRKGYGRAILRLALERTRTPLCVATVRVDNVYWLRVISEEGFRDVETLGSDGSQVRFLVRQVRRGVAPPGTSGSAASAPQGNA